LLNRPQKVERSVARDDDSSAKAGNTQNPLQKPDFVNSNGV